MKRPLAAPAVTLAFALVPRAVSACPICFQNADSAMLDAARAGVLVMVAVTLVVLGAFGRWFLALKRLQARSEEQEPR